MYAMHRWTFFLPRNGTEIARHPRNLTFTVRRRDTTRSKEARAREKARKGEELLQKHEEVKQVKALKSGVNSSGSTGGWRRRFLRRRKTKGQDEAEGNHKLSQGNEACREDLKKTRSGMVPR